MEMNSIPLSELARVCDLLDSIWLCQVLFQGVSGTHRQFLIGSPNSDGYMQLARNNHHHHFTKTNYSLQQQFQLNCRCAHRGRILARSPYVSGMNTKMQK